MVVQDDSRERELIGLFGLLAGDARGGTDAFLEINGVFVPFELKSTTTGSVTTVRDFGPDHIEKWRGRHWLIGCYSRKEELLYCHYGSPQLMAPWISEKERYISSDFALARRAPELLTLNDLHVVLGERAQYSIRDAKQIQKKQYTAVKYRELMDVPGGYSAERMLEIFRDRCRYVIERGSTLNNPHVPASYFEHWEKISPGDKGRFLELVTQALRDEG